MQNNSSQKELKLELNNTDRPLQKSMMQLNTQYSPRSPQSRPTPFDTSSIGTLKKSEISSKESATSSSTINTTNQTSFNFSQATQGFQPLFNRQNKKTSYLQAGTTSPALKGLLSPIKSEIKYQSNPQDSLKQSLKTQKTLLATQQSKASNFQLQLTIQEIVNQVKERHLPHLLSKLKKEIYDDIYNLRLQFQAFRDQTRSAIKKQEGSILEMKFLQTKAGHSDSKLHIGDKKDDLSELQTSYFLLEGKISEIETRISQHFKLNCDQFDKLQAKISEHQLRNSISIGTIKSTLPPLLLQYKQIFNVKKGGNNHEVVINSITYHIDKFGNLLDNQNHYLIDRRGYQIKLQEKHFKLLETHHLVSY